MSNKPFGSILLLIVLTSAFTDPWIGSAIAQQREVFSFLEEDKKGNVGFHYFGVEGESKVQLEHHAANLSLQETGEMVTVDGQIRIHHQIGFVDLARKPDELKHFRTISRWIATERVEESDNLWRIGADKGSVLEIFVNLDNPNLNQQVPLYLAPRFEGHINLRKGEKALIFGQAYVGPTDLTITWDGVSAARRGIVAFITILLVTTLAVALGCGTAAILIRRKKQTIGK